MPKFGWTLRYKISTQLELLSAVWLHFPATITTTKDLCCKNAHIFFFCHQIKFFFSSDSIIIAVVNAATSIIAGFVIFSVIGHIADQRGVTIAEAVDSGPGLVFVTYPVAFNSISAGHFFAAIFFFVLILLGIDSQVEINFIFKFFFFSYLIWKFHFSFFDWKKTKIRACQNLRLK